MGRVCMGRLGNGPSLQRAEFAIVTSILHDYHANSV